VFVNPDLLPALPTLFDTVPPASQSGARLGEIVTIEGVRLLGAGHRVRLTHRLVQTPIEIVPASINADGSKIGFTLPNNAAAQSALAPGQWSVSVRFTPTGAAVERETNAVPMILAPAPIIVADVGLGLPGLTVVRAAAPPRVTVTLF